MQACVTQSALLKAARPEGASEVPAPTDLNRCARGASAGEGALELQPSPAPSPG
jgi:hypothetical protein